LIAVESLPVERLDEWLDVRNRLEPDDPLELELLVHRRGRDPHLRDLLATVDGVPAGVAMYGRMLDDRVSPIGRVAIGVLPEFRRRGVATALHRALSELGRGHGDEELEEQVVAPTPETDAYVAARGYRAVPRMIESRLDLRTAPGNSSSLEYDLEVRSAADDPAVLEGAFVVALEAEPDIPEVREWVRPSSFEEWRAREIDDAVFVPEASLVAYIGGEPVAYGLVQRERAGVGAHLATGVARAHRGRGLAIALKQEQIERARTVGLRELRTWNEEGNAAIRAVNARLGYRVAHPVVTYRGPLLAR
jgi:GNAT superfamily N-acetyltransferase